MSLLTRKTALLAKKESSYGVDASPSVSVDALNIIDVVIKPNKDTLERDTYRQTFSKPKPLGGAQDTEVSFKCEIKGSGTAGTAPAVGKLLKACGMSETVVSNVSVTYAPKSDDAYVDSLTLYVYKDRILHKITGARGAKLEIDAQAAKLGYFNFSFKGLYKPIADVAAPVISNLEVTLPPTIKLANFSWGSYAAVASKLNIDMGLVCSRRGDFNASRGVGAFRISGRDPKGSFNPDAVLEDTHPFWGDWDAGTLRALSIKIGETAGGICTITAPKCFSEGPEYNDEDGVMVYNVPFRLTENSDSVGDDEISIAFT
jgi:hypothetical protein